MVARPVTHHHMTYLSKLAVAFVASIILLGTSIILTRTPPTISDHLATRVAWADSPRAEEPHNAIDSAGILHTTWLLGNEPHLAAVQVPKLHALREAGMFDIHVRERIARRYRAKEDGECETDTLVEAGKRSEAPALSLDFEREDEGQGVDEGRGWRLDEGHEGADDA